MFTNQGLESWQLDPITVETKLNYTNYSVWSARLKIILEARGLWGLVDGTEFVPEADTEEAAFRRWKMRDACARLQLIHNLPDNFFWIIMRSSTVREAWDALLEHLQPKSTFKRSLTLRNFHSLRVSEDGDVRTHVLRMCDLWQDVLNTGAYTPSPEADNYFVITLLDSLPSSFSAFAATWKFGPQESRATGSTLVGHILDLDAWNRGRAEAHKKPPPGQRKPRMLED